MVRTEPIQENLANLKLSFGASPGPVVRPTDVKNDFLVSYRGVGIGDEVAIDKLKGKKTGRAAEMLSKHLVRVELEGGRSKSVDAARLFVKTPAEPQDLTSTMQEPPEWVGGPPAEALVVLPRKDDAVKVCDGAERFWTLVTSVDGDVVHGIVINRLVGGQAFAAPGTRIKFLKSHIYMIEAYLPMPAPSGPRVQLALSTNAPERAIAHFRAAYREKIGDEKYQQFMKNFGSLPSFCPVENKEDVAAWFRAEAKKDPSILDGSNGLVPDDLGIAIMMSLEQAQGHHHIFMNLGNMILMPRVAAACMTE